MDRDNIDGEYRVVVVDTARAYGYNYMEIENMGTATYKQRIWVQLHASHERSMWT